MKGITWSRDSHGLFDYESRHLTKKTMKSQNPSKIVRKQNELEILNLDKARDDSEQDQKPLLNIINDNGKRFFNHLIRFRVILPRKLLQCCTALQGFKRTDVSRG